MKEYPKNHVKTPIKESMVTLVLLNVITLMILLLPMEWGSFFGVSGDWDSQHVGAAELLRQTMITQGAIFPQFTYAGGGTNIYDFAYYGFLRPDVILSCFIPGVPMKYIIAVYCIFQVMASVTLCYIWLKGQQVSKRGAMFGSVLLVTANCFIQAHRQIMFVSFMPFLMLALLGIDRLLEKRKSLLFVLALVMIYLHSFYYAPACLVVCGFYGIYRLTVKVGEEGGAMASLIAWKPAGKAIVAVALSLAISAVFLLPTGLDILSTVKDGGSFVAQPMKLFDGTLEGLLYEPYGCGMSLLSLYGLVSAICKGRENRPLAILAGGILFSMAVPAVSWVLNGFLYARAKILIPFLPLVVLVTVKALNDWKKERPRLLPALVCLLPFFFWEEELQRTAALADGILLLIIVVYLRHKWKDRGIPNLNRYMACAVMTALLAIPILTSYEVSSHGGWIKSEDFVQNPFNADELKKCGILPEKEGSVGTEALYRMDVIYHGLTNSNTVPDGSIQQTSMYSSVTDDDYGTFYYETIGNPIAIRNRVALLPSENPIFNDFMGVRYLVTKADGVPVGYQPILKKGDMVLSEKEDVLTVCYGASLLMEEEFFETLNRQERLEALSRYTIVNDHGTETGDGSKDFVSHWAQTVSLTEPIPAAEAASRLAREVNQTMKSSRDNCVLLVEFDVNSPKQEEVVITIGNMDNKLASHKAPYPNRNYHFTYLIGWDEGTDLSIEASQGDYTIENLQMFTIPSEFLKKEAAKATTHGWEPDGHTMFQGTVDMKEAGWIVTSYPYREGYQVIMDGQEVTAQKVNTAFVGVAAGAGKHEIVIRYTAPGFEMGLLVSIAGILGLAVLMFRQWIQQKKRRI
ncbi:MAG: YfhO family protein [Firmicutes bacterium]|nr:YfhO family protein [Bacillota bacterium]